MSARDELREYADRYGYTEHVNALLDAFAAEVKAEARAEDIALIEDRADDADFTEEPLYIVGLRSAADLLKNAASSTRTAGDEQPETERNAACVAELRSVAEDIASAVRPVEAGSRTEFERGLMVGARSLRLRADELEAGERS